MGTPLTSATVASTYQALFKTSTNAALSAVAMRRVSDGLGNDTTIYVGLTDINNRGGGNRQQNTAFGEGALIANTTGSVNVAIGNGALSAITTQGYNTAVGSQSQGNATGGDNTSLGYRALAANTGQFNIAIGSAAAQFSQGDRNIIIGGETCPSSTGSDNIVFGYQANTFAHSNCLLIGKATTATANNQFVINAGLTTTEALTPTDSWAIRINGTNYKIPLQVA
jgi:hypothetical protein